ncbi:trehalose 6-phosphate phosphatase [Suillus paluster]|uniref:trehalose 6-phosphate phosphatase n=1 Tax=Suillus paluster TaxID=48578 RepID=UPI001B869559|nr:trehalose 6-phosphate phosphatase [Suillus paluster]KAG1748389.1 trehalose 6-phosphate phosphatase [Suillus paluster]
MDTFAEPYTRAGDNMSLSAVRDHVRALEARHKANGVQLSGRIIHVCHYLPVTCTLTSSSTRDGVLSPPPTPPHILTDVPPSPVDDLPPTLDAPPAPPSQPERWKLAPRYGHSAMTSGIRSLSVTHEQLILGWTGDILSPATPSDGADGDVNPSTGERVPSVRDRIPASRISQEDKDALNVELANYTDKNGFIPSSADKRDEIGKPITYLPLWMEDNVAHGHYDGYCKQTLWPLFHYLLWQDVATEHASADANYEYYEQANQAFTTRLASVLQPGDLVWVHDYHLLLVPRMLRNAMHAGAISGVGGESGGDVIIGLFVHTPFPSSEVFRCLPRRKEILDGMLGANLICFQTYSYTRHFTSTCVRVCGYETTSRASMAPPSASASRGVSVAAGGGSRVRGVSLTRSKSAKGGKEGVEKYVGIDVQGHVAAVTHCPVGVDAERVARDTLRTGVQPKLEALRVLYADKKIIVGRDKLDVVKGVLQKLRAFEKLLHDYPEWQRKVVLIQVTSPALTDSPKLERQVSELVAHINGEYGSLDFIPVHHYHQTLRKDEFYALLSAADLGVITPLRDGMNTTSMEFVIAQERTKRSPLVLSEFMGISQHMADALQVNPWDLGDVAAAMNKGLVMSEEEKVARHAALHKVVTTHTSHTWAAVLAKMLLSQINGQNTARQTPYLPRDTLKDLYDKAGKRLFLFDYDGTLTPIVKMPSMALPSPDALTALSKLTSDPANLVYIVSGRDQAFLEEHLGHFKRLGMSAEHGGFIRSPDSATWMNFTASLDMGWMEEVAEIFRYYTERTTGSHIEMKKSSITWHYRSTDPEWGQFQCRQCQDLLENNVVPKRPIEVLVGKKNLEVRPIAVNKGEIVKRILYQNPGVEFIFCAGDDKTDEDMFRALLLFPPSSTDKVTMEPPLSVVLVDNTKEHTDVELAVSPEAVFTTAVGHSSKRTLASWHVTTPEEVVGHMLHLIGETPQGSEELRGYL